MIGSRRNVLIALTLASTLGFVASNSAAQSESRFVSIENILGFSGFFNVGQGTVRIVALVSPTSPECAASLVGIRRILVNNPTNRLRAYVVFLPILENDSDRTALIRSADVIDRRVACFWDPNLAVAGALKPVLDPGANGSVYLVFDTDAVFREKPDAPKLWMSATDTRGPHAFDVDALEAAVIERLDAFEKQQKAPKGGNR